MQRCVASLIRRLLYWLVCRHVHALGDKELKQDLEKHDLLYTDFKSMIDDLEEGLSIEDLSSMTTFEVGELCGKIFALDWAMTGQWEHLPSHVSNLLSTVKQLLEAQEKFKTVITKWEIESSTTGIFDEEKLHRMMDKAAESDEGLRRMLDETRKHMEDQENSEG